MDNGESASSFIHQIGERFESLKDNDRKNISSVHVVVDDEISVGYLFISSSVNDEVFLEYLVLK